MESTKSVGSLVDDSAVQAQGLTNSLAPSSAFSAASVAFALYDLRRDNTTNLGEIGGEGPPSPV